VARVGKTLASELGWGYEGLVYATSSKTAIKVYIHENLYQKERDVYLRLREHGVRSVMNFKVPRLVDWTDDLCVVEMTVVSPPFILDFAGAYLDEKPPFDADRMQEWEEEKIEQFEDRWPEVRSAMSCFRRYGIHLNDVKPGNVTFSDRTAPPPTQ
jgi:hypothetical protein